MVLVGLPVKEVAAIVTVRAVVEKVCVVTVGET